MALSTSRLHCKNNGFGSQQHCFLFRDHCIGGVKRCDCMMIMTFVFLVCCISSTSAVKGSWRRFVLRRSCLCSGVLRDQFEKCCLVVVVEIMESRFYYMIV